MNFIGIDPSLTSTAVCVNTRDGFTMLNYTKESYAYNKSGLSKWYKLCEEQCKYRFINMDKEDLYSDSEINKVKNYEETTDMIIEDILSIIDETEDTYVSIEGYNYNAEVGHIIDLVTFSTLLRIKLLNCGFILRVIAPKSLKLEACKLIYEPVIVKKGKKEIEKHVNNIGIPGGNFTKHDMFQSVLDSKETNGWVKHCKSVPEVLEVKTFPKPYEDLTDAYILCQLLIKNRV